MHETRLNLSTLGDTTESRRIPSMSTQAKPASTTLSKYLSSDTNNAYTSAMRALQTRITLLEAQNKTLMEQKFHKDKNTEEETAILRQKLIEETAKSSENDKKWLEKVRELVKENEALKQRFYVLGENELYIKSEWERAETEKLRHLEQNALEREEWRTEKNALLQQLGEANERIQSLAKEREQKISEINTLYERVDMVTKMFVGMKKGYEMDMKKLKEDNAKCKIDITNIKAKFAQDVSSVKSVVEKLKRMRQKNKEKQKTSRLQQKNKINHLQRIIENQKKELEALSTRAFSPKSSISVVTHQGSIIGNSRLQVKPKKTLKVETENSDVKSSAFWSPKGGDQQKMKEIEQELTDLKEKYKVLMDKCQNQPSKFPLSPKN